MHYRASAPLSIFASVASPNPPQGVSEEAEGKVMVSSYRGIVTLEKQNDFG